MIWKKDTKSNKKAVYYESKEDLYKADFNDPTKSYYFGKTKYGPTQWSICILCNEVSETSRFNKLNETNENKGICRSCFLKNKGK